MTFYLPARFFRKCAPLSLLFVFCVLPSPAWADCQGTAGVSDGANGWIGTDDAETITCDNDPELIGEPGIVDAKNGRDTIYVNGAVLKELDSGRGNDRIEVINARIAEILAREGADVIIVDNANITDLWAGSSGDQIRSQESGHRA